MSAPVSPLRYRDLGTLRVERDGVALPISGRRLTAALSLLLINLDQRVSVDALIDAVWGGAPPSNPDATLQSHLLRLRRLLEAEHVRRTPFDTLVHDAGGFRLIAPPAQVDSAVFTDAISTTRDLLLAGRATRALERSTEALGMWRGRPWSPHTDEAWAVTAAAQLEEMRAQLRQRRVDCLLAVGSVDQAVVDLDGLVTEYPLREHLWALRMLAMYRLGRREEALTTFTRARQTLIEEVGVEPGTELRELQHWILTADPSLGLPDPTSVAAPRGEGVPLRLPRKRAPLLGRDGELAALSALLPSTRVLTVTGPPGCGKTRLVIDAARNAADQFHDGVWFVDLVAVDDQNRLVDAITSALGLQPPGSGTAEQALQAFVRDREMLLILDGCGPASGAAEMVDQLVADSEVNIAVTSREPLGMEDERVWPLSPLAVPAIVEDAGRDAPGREGRAHDLDRLAAEPAVQLFVRRAGSVGTEFDRSQLPTVAAICTALDGLPLAIELAAAQARSFTLDEILRRVRFDPAGLRREGRGTDHASTLADLIGQSTTTLSSTQRHVHRALAVLPGEFTAGAAAAVVGQPANSARDAISGLVVRSLLVPEGARPGSTTSRFRQLAAIRSDAQNSTPAADLGQAARRRDAWVRRLVEERPVVGGVEEPEWFGRVDDDLAAVRATLQRCLVDVPTATGPAVAARLGVYWYYRGMGTEWLSWTRLAVRAADADPFDRVLVGLSLACAVSLADRTDLGRPYVDAADAWVNHHLPPDSSSVDLTAAQLSLLGEHYFHVAAMGRATRDLDLSVRAAAAVGRLAQVGADTTLTLLAEIGSLLSSTSTGDPGDLLARTATAYDQALAEHNRYAAWSVATVGAAVGLRTGDAELGLKWSDRTILQHVELGVEQAVGPLGMRGSLLASTGRFAEATVVFTAARVQARRCGQRWPRHAIATALVARAESGLSTSELDRARREGSRLRLVDVIR